MQKRAWCWMLLLGVLFLFPKTIHAETSLLDSLEMCARRTYRNDLDSSRYFARQVRRLAVEGEVYEKVAWADNWTAICFIKNGLSDSVTYYLDRCIAYCEQYRVDEVKGKAHLNQAINQFQLGAYEEAVIRGLRALRHFEKIGDTLGTAHAFYNTGLSYFRLEKYEQAQDLYAKALPIYREKGGVLDRANTLNAIGSVWTAKSQSDSALHYHQMAVAEKMAVNAWAYCGSEYANIAAIYEEEKQFDEAVRYYMRSFKAHRAIGDLRGEGLVAGNLSGFKLDANELDSAIYYAKISAEFAATTDDRLLYEQSHFRLSRAYFVQGKYKEAYYHDALHDSIREVIADAEVRKNVDELYIQYETEKREKELAQERYKSQRKSFWLIGSVAGIFGLLVAILLVIRSEREKKKRLLMKARASLEAERNRISMDLHDHLGAELSVITSRLDAQAFRAGEAADREILTTLANQAREANSQLRETIWSVRSTEVSLEQFCMKVREFAQRMLAESGARFEQRSEGSLDLTPVQALGLFRVVQEGINNARKYSGASNIRFEVVRTAGELYLQLSDDGRGFSPKEVKAGYGLQNMRERIEGLSGRLEFLHVGGTTLKIFIPLKT